VNKLNTQQAASRDRDRDALRLLDGSQLLVLLTVISFLSVLPIILRTALLFIYFKIIWYKLDTYNARSLISINTRTQILI
jgi:hypothetical protein